MSELTTFSDPPLVAKKEKNVTFADVAMRFVQDLPIFVVLLIIGAMAIKGQADARDFVITGLGTLLARSWPKAVQIAGNAGIALFIGGALAIKLTACAPSPSAKPAEYGAELAACNLTAKTCKESVDCENRVRVKYSRPLRVINDWEKCE